MTPQPCPHRHSAWTTTGGWHYAGGEVWDDVQEVEVCLDCGAVLYPVPQPEDDLLPDPGDTAS